MNTAATIAETWDALDPWATLVDRFEQAVGSRQNAADSDWLPAACCSWQDELRALELDDAARRSAAKGRSSTLEFQEATEEAGFKGTMTLVGCSMIWITLIVLILSAWVPWLAWLIVPVFGIFLLLQALRWVVKDQGANSKGN